MDPDRHSFIGMTAQMIDSWTGGVRPPTSLQRVCCGEDCHLQGSDVVQSTGKSLLAARSISR